MTYSTFKDFLKTATTIFIVCIVGVILFAGIKSCCAGCEWNYNVTIQYVYEGETETHEVSFPAQFRWNNSVKDMDVVWSAPAGYINVLVIYADITTSPNHGHTYRHQEIMNVPDRKFQVTNIISTRSERIETQW